MDASQFMHRNLKAVSGSLLLNPLFTPRTPLRVTGYDARLVFFIYNKCFRIPLGKRVYCRSIRAVGADAARL